MIKSMTGYGRGKAKHKTLGRCVAEVQGVNKKYSEVHVSLPYGFMSLEADIKGLINKHVCRGKISVFISFSLSKHKKNNVYIDKDLVKQYVRSLRSLKKELNIGGQLDINFVTRIKDVFCHAEEQIDPKTVLPILKQALSKAIVSFTKMRQNEGKALAKHIKEIISSIENCLVKVEKAIPRIQKQNKARMLKKIREMGLDVGNNDERVQKEVAILSERSDVTEEIVRAKNHLHAFRGLLSKNDAVGRTMDFLVQELLREINTLGSKTSQNGITSHVIFIKGQIEKIREQIQNIE